MSAQGRWPALAALSLCLATLHADRLPGALGIRFQDGHLTVFLAPAPIPPVAGMHYRLSIETSPDLTAWTASGELTDGPQGLHFVSDPTRSPFLFHRLRPELQDDGTATSDGAERLGLNRVFHAQLETLGALTPAQFASQYQPHIPYIDQIGFDPRSAAYWTNFDADPAVANLGKATNSPDWRSFDFRLNTAEQALFMRNGFVVSERLGADRYASVYYRIFNDDLPVFVTADSVLHAWHFSFQHILSEMEELTLAPTLSAILDGMAGRLGLIPNEVREGPLKSNLEDADYFLAVGRSLASGLRREPVLNPHPGFDATLQAIQDGTLFTEPGFEMFGSPRPMDFSQFKPRSYYTRSTRLSNYFQAWMWTSRADLRLFGGDRGQSLREFRTAVVLCLLLKESGYATAWKELDDVIRLFVGSPDSMGYAHLMPLLDAYGIHTLADITSTNQLADMHDAVAKGNLGLQLIPGDVHFSPLGAEQAQLPRAFTLIGQRFVLDGWALSQVTAGRIVWPVDIPGITLEHRVLRRIPSAVDVAYSILGNPVAHEILSNWMLASVTPGNFRDGFPYAHNLQAVRETINRFTPEAWWDTIYMRWLDTLRELSIPTTSSAHPQAMRTKAWAFRTLNTQLASYTELKHDTLLYGKQPYAGIFLCDYPAGFVEPIPSFWLRFRAMVETAAVGMTRLPVAPGIISYTQTPGSMPISVDVLARHRARIGWCWRTATTLRTLEALATKELLQQPFTETDTAFIKGLMNSQDHGYYGPTFDGWYPDLYYKDFALANGSGDQNGSNRPDTVVADLFTSPPDPVVGDLKGGILHEGTRGVDLLLIAVDNGTNKTVYAGPLTSHYEFVPATPMQRLNDADWVATKVPRPPWTQSYLVPGP